MKRLMGLLTALALVVALTALPAVGSPDHDDGGFEEHAHVLVINVEFDADGNPISVKQCVDLANNQALPNNAQHLHMHFGQAGVALAEHNTFVVPVAPFPAPYDDPVEWTDCESLLAAFGL